MFFFADSDTPQKGIPNLCKASDAKHTSLTGMSDSIRGCLACMLVRVKERISHTCLAQRPGKRFQKAERRALYFGQ